MLLLSPLATNRLTITATDNILDDVVQEVKRFVEKNTVHTEVVRLSTSRHKFFVTFFLQKVKAINKELEAHRVNIDIVWMKRFGEVLLKGTKQGLVLARAKLTELEAKIVCHTYKEKDRLRVKVLTSSDKSYEADLHNACTESRCMYSFEQEEPGPKISPADTERAITVSVVQGEIQLFLYTENKNRTSCAQDFVEKLDKAARKLMVSEERSYDYETLTALSRDEEQEIIKIGEQHDVKIHLKTRLGRLAATGLKMDVTQVFEDKRLSDVFDVVAKRLHEQQLAKELATSYGEGVYFAVDASYSTQQTYSPPDPQGLRYVYQSKVLVGHCTQGKARMKVPPSRDGPILYDSLVDNPRRPSIYVIFNDTQAYPEYLITFQ
nr:hypothetical protein BaRGS_032070 [Batillaria attramentaria]